MKILEGGGVSDRIFTDAFRGVAILMVILSHCADKLGTNVFTPLGGTGVAIFLILSGFGLSESYKKKGLNGFIAGKLIKIWLPFAIFILVVALLQENFDFKEILFSIFSVSPRQYWYVHHLLRCYFVFWIAYRFAYRYRWAILITFSIYTFVGMRPINAEQCLSFPLGILLSEKRDWLDRLSRKEALRLGMLFAVLGVSCLVIKQLPVVRSYIDTYIYYAVETGIKLPLGLATMLILWILPVSWVTGRILIFCGTLSYELYLVHMQLLDLVKSSVSASMMILICLFLSYSISIASQQIRRKCLKPVS